jgi:hypothetical protein
LPALTLLENQVVQLQLLGVGKPLVSVYSYVAVVLTRQLCECCISHLPDACTGSRGMQHPPQLRRFLGAGMRLSSLNNTVACCYAWIKNRPHWDTDTITHNK